MTIRVLLIHAMIFHHNCWQKAADSLDDTDIELTCISQSRVLKTLQTGAWDIVVADLAPAQKDYAEILLACQNIPHRLVLSADSDSDGTTYSATVSEQFKLFTQAISVANYGGALLLLAAEAGYQVESREIQPVLNSGLYHPAAGQFFPDLKDYLEWRESDQRTTGNRVGVLFYYGQLVEENVAEIDQLIRCLEEQNLCPVPVFSPGISDDEQPPEWLSIFNASKVGALINVMTARLLATQTETRLLEQLNIPIFQAIRTHSQTPEQWLDDAVGLPPMTMVFSHNYPEMFGAVRPTVIAGCRQDSSDGHVMRPFLPIDERIATLVRRVKSHLRLRQLENRHKRLTVVLHNNPCKGVEATIGQAVGLSSFKSLGLLLASLKEQGYDVGDAPHNGEEILNTLLERKAVAEFRWTTIDEIVAKGGVLAMISRAEYDDWFMTLDEQVQTKVNADWGEFPGQGMVWQDGGEEVLVITGLRYGNIHIINQPKRGCYGAKCTGEVCRILHDPNLAPPHHWLATYRYIQQHSDAVIHFGTEGALEYLPGKQSGMSGCCFSEVSLGDLPNFYIYVMDAVGEGLMAKRRAQGMLVDHLGPIFSPAHLDAELVRLDDLLNQHQQAPLAQQQLLEAEMAPLLKLLELDPQGADVLTLARRSLHNLKQRLAPEGLHTLGQSPDVDACSRLLTTMLRNPPPGVPDCDDLSRELSGREGDYANVTAALANLLNANATGTASDSCITPALERYCRTVSEGLQQCHAELDNLQVGLAGGYIAPGLGGSLCAGQSDALPTGRNFFGKDVNRLPTPAAWQTGQQLAVALASRYLQEEGEFPETVGLSIWSSDAFKQDGELFCQILALMGIQPQWDRQGKVIGLELIPLEDLTLTYDGQQRQRPRIDVIMETSGIMRDMVPSFCVWLDRAAVLASSADEAEEWNYVRKHSQQRLAELRAETDAELSDSDMQRLSTVRLFSTPPGSYGNGVGLALDASAWNNDRDLAEIYLNWAGHAYGEGLQGQVAHQLFARHMQKVDIAYMKQSSAEYDVLDCGCYAVAQGSMAATTRVLGGGKAKLYWHEPGSATEISDSAEQLLLSTRTRLLNRQWFEEMKEHGYQGAMEVSNRINNLFKWSATTHAVSKELFDQVTSTYIENEANREWLNNTNPYALEEITRRLLEAHSRELWQADPERLAAVQEAALLIEGDMEEDMGDVREEFQGSKVEVLTSSDVATWNLNYRLPDTQRANTQGEKNAG